MMKLKEMSFFPLACRKHKKVLKSLECVNVRDVKKIKIIDKHSTGSSGGKHRRATGGVLFCPPRVYNIPLQHTELRLMFTQPATSISVCICKELMNCSAQIASSLRNLFLFPGSFLHILGCFKNYYE